MNRESNEELAPSPDVPRKPVQVQVDRILASKRFVRSPSLSQLLRFAVEETLAGRGASLKEYRIGVEVFRRGESFDPRLDPLVRVQAGKLRHRLKEYYDTVGGNDPLLIEFPKGGYLPIIRKREAVVPSLETPANSTRLLARDLVRQTQRSLVWLSLFTLILLGVVCWTIWPARPTPGSLTLAQLTFDNGWTRDPVISRDARLLAYTSDRGNSGTDDIWVQPLRSMDNPVQLTHHEAGDTTPDFSPDGSKIVFRSSRDGGGIYVIPVLGGEERRIVDGGFGPRFSPDGAWVVYAEAAGIFVAPATGGEPRKLSLELSNPKCPIWTPDGEHLLFLAKDEREAKYDWWVTPLEFSNPARQTSPIVKTGVSGTLRRQGLPEISRATCPSDWIDNEVIFTSDGSIFRIPLSLRTWKVSGPASQVLPGPDVNFPVRVWPGTGGRPSLVFSAGPPRAHLWSLPIEANRGAPLAPLEQLTHDLSLRPGLGGTVGRLSADGKKLAFASNRSGNLDIWLKDLATGQETALSSSRWPEDKPLLNADGSKVVYMCDEGHSQAMYLASTTAPQQAQRLCGECGEPKDWSADEERILYITSGSLACLGLRTGHKTELLKNGKYKAREAAFSPDGRWIALVAEMARGTRFKAFLVPFDGVMAVEAKWVPVMDESSVSSLHWSPDGNLLYFFHLRDGFRCLWAQRLHAVNKRPVETPFPVQHFHKSQRYPVFGSWISVARDRLAVNLSEHFTNIWITELQSQP